MELGLELKLGLELGFGLGLGLGLGLELELVKGQLHPTHRRPVGTTYEVARRLRGSRHR